MGNQDLVRRTGEDDTMSSNIPRQERTPEEKKARREFFRSHGVEVRMKQQAFETLIRSSVHVDGEGHIDHPVLLSVLLRDHPHAWVEGFMPNNCVYFVPKNDPDYDYGPNPNNTFLRCDHVIFPLSWTESWRFPPARVVKVGDQWLVDNEPLHWDYTYRTTNGKVRSWPAWLPVKIVN